MPQQKKMNLVQLTFIVAVNMMGPGSSCYPPTGRAAVALDNAVRRIRGNSFRAFVHPASRMTRAIEGAGFRLAAARQTWQWSVDVYVRQAKIRRLSSVAI